jgi:polar amino acid transport system permease protein
VTPSIIASAVGLTLLLFVSSYLMAAVLGVGVGALRLSNNAVLRAAGAAWIAFFRGIPSLVWLFIIFFGVSISGDRLTAVSAAAVTFGLVGSAYLAEAYRAGFESLPRGQMEALNALGMPRLQAFRIVVLPQILPVVLATATAYAINLVKDTALASLIGVQEITFIANDQVQRGANGLITFLAAGVIYLVLSVLIGLVARFVESGMLRRKNRLVVQHA